MGVHALRKDQYGVISALRSCNLLDRKLLGRGVFSMVFEGHRKNTVLKLTVDDASYWLFNDPYIGVQHRHFPRVLNSFGDVGEVFINGKRELLYLFEMERLERIESGNARKLAKFITKRSTLSRLELMAGSIPSAESRLQAMVIDKTIPLSFRNAMSKLNDFLHDFNAPEVELDFHMGNMMQRRNGDVVVVDPICNCRIWDATITQLGRRGW